MSQYKRTLSDDDVDALFAGKFAKEEIPTCDNCTLRITDNDALTFGDKTALIASVADVFTGNTDLAATYEWAYEMPVEVGGQLERELQILRRRHERETITLCYACVDVLQAPICGIRQPKLTLTLRSTNPVDELAPRLFAVE